MEFTPRTVLLLLLAVVAAVLLHEGSTQEDSQRCSANAAVGGTAILPLNLTTLLDRSTVKVEWYHNKTYVYVFQNNQPYLKYQNEAFKNRAFLFEDQISEGNVSLKLINVTEQDAGIYKCIVVCGTPPKTEKFEFKLDIVDGSPHEDPTGTWKIVGGVAVVAFIIIAVVCYIFGGNGNNHENPNNPVEPNPMNNPDLHNPDNPHIQ